MTRKDYILIAEVLRVEYHNEKYLPPGFVREPERMQTIIKIASEIADALQRDNSRFDREHFLSVVRGEKDLNSHPARS